MEDLRILNEDLQALRTAKAIMNDVIENPKDFINHAFLMSISKVCTVLRDSDTAKTEELMKIYSVLDDDICQLYGNDPTGLEVLGYLKTNYSTSSVGDAAGMILKSYNVLNEARNIAQAGAKFFDSLEGFEKASADFYNDEISDTIYRGKVNEATTTLLEAIGGIVEFIPMIGDIAGAIVDALSWCYDQLFSLIDNHLTYIETQAALCDYLSGQIYEENFLATLSGNIGSNDSDYFTYLNTFKTIQNDFQNKYGNAYINKYGINFATFIKTKLRDWSIEKIKYEISLMDENERANTVTQIAVEQYISSVDKQIDGISVDNQEIETIKSIMLDVSNQTGTAENKVVDPLAFDLNGDGFRLLSVSNGVYFDMDKNGTRERVGWIGGDDAFLAYDRNGDGIINDSGELFGDNTVLKTGLTASTGFEALMEWDENNDGVIDENDPIFSHLLIWRDITQDGVSNPGELMTLTEAGITAIRLNFTTQNRTDSSGTIITRTATFVMDDNTESTIGEFDFQQVLYDTNDDEIVVEISNDILALPNVRSLGNALSLHKAMALDTTGDLQDLVEEFCEEDDRDEQLEILTDIIYFLADATLIDPDSRGGNFDARKLAALECMLGERYIGAGGNPNPNVLAAPELEKAFNNLLNLYYVQLLPNTNLSDYMQLISYTNEDKNEFNLHFLNTYIDFIIFYDQDKGEKLLKDFGTYFYYVEKTGIKCFDNFKNYFMKKSPELAMMIDTTLDIAILGTDQSDFLNVSSERNSLYGLAGDDYVYGNDGNDTLDGGTGNDYLEGRYGSDTYVFDTNHGADTIYDTSGNDQIQINEDVENIIFSRNNNDLLISEFGTTDTITVQNWYGGNNNQIESIVTDDGATITNIQVEQLIQAMAAFTSQNNISWNDAISQNSTGVSNIVEQFWVR
jgi:hypothetical protein